MTDVAQWSSRASDLDQGLIDSPFDQLGEYRMAHDDGEMQISVHALRGDWNFSDFSVIRCAER